jgi:hypothetical protein
MEGGSGVLLAPPAVRSQRLSELSVRSRYRPTLRAIMFAIRDCGFTVRSALEVITQAYAKAAAPPASQSR